MTHPLLRANCSTVVAIGSISGLHIILTAKEVTYYGLKSFNLDLVHFSKHLQILMLNVIASSNHKHHCVRKRCFCSGYLLDIKSQYYARLSAVFTWPDS